MLLNFSLEIQENTRQKVFFLTGGAPPNFRRRHRVSTFSTTGAFVFSETRQSFQRIRYTKKKWELDVFKPAFR